MSLEIKNLILSNNLDGYILPKNDSYFTEYSKINNLKSITNFSGSAGFAIFLKNKKYLFVDGRYTIQAEKESGKSDYNLIPLNLKLKNKKKSLNSFSFYSLNSNVAGNSVNQKLNQLIKIMLKRKIDYIYVSAGENICWLLNIRGKDLPNSPVANCKMILTKKREIYFFSDKKKVKTIKLSLKKLKIFFLDENNIMKCLNDLTSGKFCIDSKTCSVFEEGLINYKFKITGREDPIYYLKSLKNKT